MITINSVAFAVRQIFTEVNKFKSRSSKPGQISFDLFFACRQKTLSSMRTPKIFEISRLNHSREIGANILKNLGVVSHLRCDPK